MYTAKSRRKTPATSQRNPFSSKAGCERSVSTTLIDLPSEILLDIFHRLGNLDNLFSTILTCRRFLNIFQMAQQSLIQSTFAIYTCLKSDRVIYKALIQLRQVIQRDIIDRDVARSIFELAWIIFRSNHQQEWLIPFGRALAWSFVLDNREPDGISVLHLIRDGLPPFEQSKEKSQLPIQPIQALLEKLLSTHGKDSKLDGHAGFGFALLELPSRGNVSITLNDVERTTLLKDGILFKDRSIVVRHSRPQPLKMYPGFSHRGLPSYGPRDPGDSEATNILEILAHKGPSDHILLRPGDLYVDNRHRLSKMD